MEIDKKIKGTGLNSISDEISQINKGLEKNTLCNVEETPLCDEIGVSLDTPSRDSSLVEDSVSNTLDTGSSSQKIEKKIKTDNQKINTLVKKSIRYKTHRNTAEESFKKLTNRNETFSSLLNLKKDTQQETQRRNSHILQYYNFFNNQKKYFKNKDDKTIGTPQTKITSHKKRKFSSIEEKDLQNPIKKEFVEIDEIYPFIVKLLKLDFSESNKEIIPIFDQIIEDLSTFSPSFSESNSPLASITTEQENLITKDKNVSGSLNCEPDNIDKRLTNTKKLLKVKNSSVTNSRRKNLFGIQPSHSALEVSSNEKSSSLQLEEGSVLKNKDSLSDGLSTKPNNAHDRMSRQKSDKMQSDSASSLHKVVHSWKKRSAKDIKLIEKAIDYNLKQYDRTIALKHNIHFLESYNRIRLIAEKFKSIIETMKHKMDQKKNEAKKRNEKYEFDESQFANIIQIIELYLPDIYLWKSSLNKINDTSGSGQSELKLEVYAKYCLEEDVKKINSQPLFTDLCKRNIDFYLKEQQKLHQYKEFQNIDFEQSPQTSEENFSLNPVSIRNEIEKKFLDEFTRDEIVESSYTNNIILNTIFSNRFNKRRRLKQSAMVRKKNDNNDKNVNPYNVKHHKISCETNMESLQEFENKYSKEINSQEKDYSSDQGQKTTTQSIIEQMYEDDDSNDMEYVEKTSNEDILSKITSERNTKNRRKCPENYRPTEIDQEDDSEEEKKIKAIYDMMEMNDLPGSIVDSCYNGTIWESYVDYKNSNNESLPKQFTMTPENQAPFMFAAYNKFRPCLSGEKCCGMTDFPEEHRFILMEYMPEEIALEFSESKTHSVQQSYCNLCIISNTCKIMNSANAQTTDIMRTPAPYICPVDCPGGYLKSALYQTIKSKTNGNCWPVLNYNPANYTPIRKKITYIDDNGNTKTQIVKGLKENGENRFFAQAVIMKNLH